MAQEIIEIKSPLAQLFEDEIREHLDSSVQIGEEEDYSQAKLVRRIGLFESHIYPTGQFDEQGDYKFWFDIITSRIDDEVKNIDIDTKNVEPFSTRKEDALPMIVLNLKLSEHARDTGQSEEINDAVEEGSGWGNVVWKRTKNGYERVDLRNFYVINTAAKTLKDSAAIERHEFMQKDLREKSGAWEYVDEVIKQCKSFTSSKGIEDTEKATTTPRYEIYERNGEVNLKDLKEYNGETVLTGDEDKYVLAKIVGAAKKSGRSVKIKYILFAGEIPEMPYEEYHRSRYKGKWMREGLYQLLMDCQVRANQIGNQIAKGLEWASKAFFTSDDKLIVQNILTEMNSGDFIQGRNLRQVEVRMQGLDQLIVDWNRNLQLANDIANSREVVQGITPPSGTPLGTTRLLNQNANKLFDFIREKFSIPLGRIFEKWVIPNLIKELKSEEILRLTGDAKMLERFMNHVVSDWYVKNLVKIGPHSEETAELLKEKKMEELKKRPQLLFKNIVEMWKGVKARVQIDISGERLRQAENLQTYAEFIALEVDPLRRSAMIEEAMRLKGIDVASLPKTEVQPVEAQAQQELPQRSRQPVVA